MEIRRGEDSSEAQHRLKFCLDQLEKAKGFSRSIDWGTSIAHGLSIEEIIGALVAAESLINEYEEDEE